jgi:glycosyltransferase involved in cell wall biosynthesis
MEISFVIPAYNEEKNIYDCCQSIRIAIAHAQLSKWEIIVVDNNSTDGTVDAVPMYAKVCYEEKQGLVWARTRGFQQTTNPLVAFIDADCRMPIDWINVALVGFTKPDVVAVSGPLNFYDTSKFLNTGSKYFYKVASQLHKYYPTIQGGNFILRADALRKVGGFDTDIQFYGEDTMTAVKLAAAGKIILDPLMYINTSGRRFKQQGVINTLVKYITNYAAIHMFNDALTKQYRNYR